MKLVIRITLLTMLFSCASRSPSFDVVQKSDRTTTVEESTEMLIKREKQSLKLAMLKLEYEQRQSRVIVAEARSLVYQASEGILVSSSRGLLPEVVKLFALAAAQKMNIYITYRNQSEKVVMRELLRENAVARTRYRLVDGKDLPEMDRLKPALILAQSYDELWPRELSPQMNKQKRRWYKRWVSMPNTRRDQLSMGEWSLSMQLEP